MAFGAYNNSSNKYANCLNANFAIHFPPNAWENPFAIPSLGKLQIVTEKKNNDIKY